MIRTLLFGISVLLLTSPLFSEDKPDELHISLLTCSPGEEIYAAFGHSAVRVIDPEMNSDIVFDFGVFDYREPDFVWKFTKGNLKYQLAVSDYTDFMAMYHRLNRGVIEEEFNLNEDEKRRLFHWMLDNYKPENRYYYYDFMWDNCSTRIRDLVDSLHTCHVPGEVHPLTGVSFRDILARYLENKKWYKFGTDMVLGARVDQRMTFEQEMFLPDYLSSNLGMYRRTDDDSKLLEPVRVLVSNEPIIIPIWKKYFTPMITFILVSVIIVILTLVRPASARMIGYVMFMIFALTGLMLVFMWIATSHYSTKENWNILWLNPIYLLIFLKDGNRLKSYVIRFLILVDLAILLFWNILPQEFNPAIIPLILSALYLKTIWMKRPRLPFFQRYQRQVQ